MPHQQIPCSHTLADSFSLFALFSTLASFVFNNLRTLFAKHRGCGYLCDISALPAPARSAGGSRRYHCRYFVAPLFCRPFIFIHLQFPPHRASICNTLCFHPLTNPFFRNFFVFTSIQNARVSPLPLLSRRRSQPRFSGNFLPIRRGSASRQSAATRDVFHTSSFLVYAQRSRGAFATFPNPCYRPHIQGGFAKCQ
jgi:hypothetical protein